MLAKQIQTATELSARLADAEAGRRRAEEQVAAEAEGRRKAKVSADRANEQLKEEQKKSSLLEEELARTTDRLKSAKHTKDKFKDKLEKARQELHAAEVSNSQLARSRDKALEAAARAVDDYKASQDFRDDVAVEAVPFIKKGYLDCLQRAQALHPDSNFRPIQYSAVYPDLDSEDENAEDEEGGGAELSLFGEETEEDLEEDPEVTIQSEQRTDQNSSPIPDPIRSSSLEPTRSPSRPEETVVQDPEIILIADRSPGEGQTQGQEDGSNLELGAEEEEEREGEPDQTRDVVEDPDQSSNNAEAVQDPDQNSNGTGRVNGAE